ncbi:MAG TPA: hypothetical protein VFS19_00240 [Planctomycetota bacterium]|nr:hypothetical protein [Planctomycetota bacterium]
MSKVCLALLSVILLPAFAPRADELADAEKEFRHAINNQLQKPLEDAIRKLTRINTPGAAKVILGAIKGNNETSVYWMLVNGAAGFGSPEALAEVTKTILANKSSPVARDIVAALQGNFASGCESALVTILREGPADLQLLVIEHMMDVGQKATVEAVIETLKKGAGSAELSRRLFRVLNVLCVETYGDTLSNWEGWWNANKHKEWNVLKAKPKGQTGGGTGTVCDDLGKHRDSEYEKLKTGKVLVIGAKVGCKCKDPHDLDSIESTIQSMRLTVEYVNKIDFSKPTWTLAKLDEYVAILVNCTFIEEHCICKKCEKGGGGPSGNRMVRCPNCDCGHKTAKYLMEPAGLDKIRKYVDMGGYLFTEDWGLREILAVKFKEFVDVGEFIRADMEVNILPKPGALSHPYMRNIFSRLKPKKKPYVEAGGTVAEGPESPDFERIDHTWKIDKDSPAIKITGGAKVTVLIYSKDISAIVKGSDAVAITFVVAPKGGGGLDPVATGAPIEQDRTKMSGGRVLHTMSHFTKQKSQTDTFTIQNLLLNFMIEASERRGIKLEKK